MGLVTIDPFRIILKKDARPVKQRSYRHSPVLAAKVQCEIDQLLLAGILRRSYSDWSSPLVVVAKANGKIRLTCNYKRVNQQSVIPVLPLPSAELGSLAGLNGAKVFSTMDLISGFFQCAIHPDGSPITTVCTTFGNYEWTRCPMGLASSPGCSSNHFFAGGPRKISTKNIWGYPCEPKCCEVAPHPHFCLPGRAVSTVNETPSPLAEEGERSKNGCDT